MPPRIPTFPLPKALLDLHPRDLASSAVASLAQVYGIRLDYSPASVAALDGLVREQLRVGRYKKQNFPGALALVISAYVGEVLRRWFDGHWGEPVENLYGTPLPFLIFTHHEYERQVNVVEDLMTYLWSGTGLSPRQYLESRSAMLQQLGFGRKREI
ncbi:MAG: hypothetical protein ACYC7E_10270 [Armatimonadota bacterium]